ncbi:YibE/F family protein [Alkaliphilus pronyensis]|uniref:YibE/F family protein n=2 Tax=Alkaliphilus pronyensis TaxID=1482732 RepID=A0A6I0F6W5_9FIRM|nr:YibE/F family protein [Alkaliphilus pronyensis]
MKKKLLNPDRIFVIVVTLLVILLFMIPTGFNDNAYPNSTRAEALVLEVDNSNVYSAGGTVLQGTQVCRVKILQGTFKGEEYEALNRFTGKLEFDKVFTENDRALVVIDFLDNEVQHVNIIDHYRINLELILFGAFVVLLVTFAGWTGIKAIISFILTILMIWKVLIPSLLKGWNPIIVSLAIVVILTICIITLVGGVNRKSLAAILGSFSGSLLTCVLAIVFGKLFKIHGAVLPFSESLLYSGYANLNLTDIFIAGIFIASAGAVMDVAMDISTSIHEIVLNNPKITTKDAIKSGFQIGRAVIGTMTTTLLLAYSGGYVALLMVFMAQGTPVVNILNLRYVSAEILHTIVGSFGLVTVAPFTAILASFLLTETSYVTNIVKDLNNNSKLEGDLKLEH